MYNNVYCNIILEKEHISFLSILFSIVVITLLTIVGGRIGAFVRPSRPYTQKLSTYESGVETVGNAWGPINSRLYAIGLIFILFEIETILLFPWATVLKKSTEKLWGYYMAITATFFIFILALGLVYAIVKGNLFFTTCANISSSTIDSNKIPVAYYQKINDKYAIFNKPITREIK